MFEEEHTLLSLHIDVGIAAGIDQTLAALQPQTRLC